jgi:predicted neutral ceramidase superfamily lipid hydrolase
MSSSLTNFLKFYDIPCKYPIGFPVIVGEVVFVYLFFRGFFGLFLLDQLVVSLFPFQMFFFLMIAVDVGLWSFLLPKNSVVFPELPRRYRINFFSFLTSVSLFLLLVLVYTQFGSLAIYFVMINPFMIQLFSSYLVSLPGIHQYPFVIYNLYPVLNEWVFSFMNFLLGFSNVVRRIYFVIAFRYIVLWSATERSSRIKFLRILLSAPPALFLVGVFQLTSSPFIYDVSATVYCVVALALFMEVIVYGTATTFRVNGKKIRVSVFDVLRRSITLDILGDAPQVENLSLAEFSEEVNIWTGVVAFEGNDNEESLIIVPSLHPGPFLTIGGSLLSYRISKALKTDYKQVMVPHSASTHDFNPTAASEISKVVKCVQSSLKNGKPEPYEFASPVLVEESTINNNTKVFCQAFSDGENQKVLIFCDLPKEYNGDLSYGVGQYLIEAAQSAGAKDAIIIDKHLYPHRQERPLYMEDPPTKELRELVQKIVEKALEMETGKILFSGAKMTRQEIDSEYKKLGKEIGIDGITLFVLKLENRDEKIAYLLFDANTVEPELNQKILKLFVQNGFKENNIIIMTSDTHQYPHFFRPFGSKKKFHEQIIATLKKLLKQTSKPQKVTMSLIRINSDLNVWGVSNWDRFLTLVLKAFPIVLVAFLLQWLVGWFSFILGF